LNYPITCATVLLWWNHDKSRLLVEGPLRAAAISGAARSDRCVVGRMPG